MPANLTLLRPLLFKLGAPLLAFAIAFAAFGLVNESASAPEGVSPALDDRAGATTAQRIADLQAAVRAAPSDVEANTALGEAFYQRSRETGDPSFFGRADRAFSNALAADAADPLALTGAATLALARHDFGQGLVLARSAHRAAPDLVRPYTAIADAQIELGRYDAAGRTLDRLVGLKPTLDAYARVSYFRELHGDLAGATGAMQLAVSAGGGSPESTAYVRALLGGIELDRGRLSAAERSFREALAAAPGYAPALAGLARLDAARGDLQGAIQRYREVVERLPLPEYALALGEVEQAAGRIGAARADYALVEVEARLQQAAGGDPGLELALLEADHGDATRAVAIARGVWRDAPSVRSADVYSWALHRAGRDSAASRMSAEAMQLGSRDPQFLYHAGVIAATAGDTAQAQRSLGAVVNRSPGFNPLHGPRARRALEAL